MPYVATRLGRWFYESHGSPRKKGDPTIVLCHGLLFDGAQWGAQLPVLSALGRVVVLDGPGHGKSEVPPPFSLDDHTRAFIDAIDALEIDELVMVGLSWGGMLAMRVALSPAASRLKAMALLDTSAEAEPWVDAKKYRVLASFARRFGLPLALVKKEIAPLMFGPKTLRERPELVLEVAQRINGYSREGVSRAAIAVVVERKSILARLGEIRVPTLVGCGRDDRATIPARSEAIARSIQGSKLVWIEDSGHMSAIERPEAVNAALVPFLRHAAY